MRERERERNKPTDIEQVPYICALVTTSCIVPFGRTTHTSMMVPIILIIDDRERER